MKNYVKEHKGHKVPEGATHFTEATVSKYEAFWANDIAWVLIDDMIEEYPAQGIPKYAVELPEADEKKMDYRNPLLKNKQEWNGEGLPPVGCRCSATWLELPDGGCNDFCEVAIKGYFDGEVWLSKVNGVGYSEVLKVKDCEFRPIKTQQEKNREAFVNKALGLCPLIIPTGDIRKLLEMSFDNGARFKVPKEGE